MPRGVGQVELVQQLGGAAAARGPAQVVQVGHEEQVLLAGEQAVDGGELAGDADRGPDGVRVGGQVVAGDADLAGVGGDQGGQDLDGGGLAGAVGAEQREDRALGDGQVDAVEHDLVAVGLAQPGGGDGRRAWVVMVVPFWRGQRCSGAADHDVAVAGAGAHLDDLSSAVSGPSAAVSWLCTRPKCVYTSSRAAVPALRPISISPKPVLSAVDAARSPRRPGRRRWRCWRRRRPSARPTVTVAVGAVDPQVPGDLADPGLAVGVLDHRAGRRSRRGGPARSRC